MVFDAVIENSSDDRIFSPLTFHDIIFSNFDNRPEDCIVIKSHLGEQLFELTLKELRWLTIRLSALIAGKGIKAGDTIMLASFSSSNELANVLLFAAAACSGIRIFIPIYPEPAEFSDWKKYTGFSHIIIPWRETDELKDHLREKEIIRGITRTCKDLEIMIHDSWDDFHIIDLINEFSALKENQKEPSLENPTLPSDDLVIFTTSGTSGKSKLVVYPHKAFAFCFQSWQSAGLFQRELFGNAGYSPLFTHTIGIRTFIHCLVTGNPFLVIVTDWFLNKPAIVRYFLMQMQPGHIIGGPAFFNTLLELFRQFPDLKTSVLTSLKAAISIGAPFDETTSEKFKSATGIRLMNGFGTTETLMISLNTGETGINPKALGKLLPGVVFGLKKSETSLFELSVKSIFQSSQTIGESEHAPFFETGDIVSYNEITGEILFSGRKSSDFIKDDYGVKIPLAKLKEYYNPIYEFAEWIEWIPLVNMPGLAALIFLNHTAVRISAKEVSAVAKTINENLKLNCEPFEYSHRHLERFALISDDVPLTRKATVSKDQIYKVYQTLIADLKNPYVFSHKIESIENEDRNYLYKYSNPYLAELLHALEIDKQYVRGERDYLYYRKGDSVQQVIDFVGGFGANLLGHNHPLISETVINFLNSGTPALNNQGSLYNYPALLAYELHRLFNKNTGRHFRVLFANSGTEATELAIHHACFEWRNRFEKLRDQQFQIYGSVAGLKEVWDYNVKLFDEAVPCIIVADKCFHGYTSGARSLLENSKQRNIFKGLLKIVPLYVNDTDNDWKNILSGYVKDYSIDLTVYQMIDGKCCRVNSKFSRIIASIIEPVRGEGGIKECNIEVQDYLAEQAFPLISDEIQCGLGRPGKIPSYGKADYYLLGKSLGGGVEKISAVLIDNTRFRYLFTKYFNTTFSNGELAAAVGLTVLKIIENENIENKTSIAGNRLKELLKELSVKFPQVIESIEGTGLMIGIVFSSALKEFNSIFRIFFENEILGYFFAAWLLNSHNIRVLPSLSRPNSLRIEPSCYVQENDMLQLRDSLDELCILCYEKKMYRLFLFLMNGDPYTDRMKPVFKGSFPQNLDSPAPGSITAGFIGNFTVPQRELQILEPDLIQASDTGLYILFGKLQVLFQGKPLKLISKNLLNDRIHFIFYIIPTDSSHLEVASRWGKKNFFIRKIQEAVNLLSAEGAECISLGAYTSILTGNGLYLAESGKTKILTGNTLTVGSCIYYLNRYLASAELQLAKPLTIAVIGATGNIGTGIVRCLADSFYEGKDVLLVGNNKKRLQNLADELHSNHLQVRITTDLFELHSAGIIIGCVNTNDPIVFSHHLNKTEPVYIIDISVPNAVSDDVRKMKNVTFCSEASSVYMQDDPDLLFSSRTPEGKVFCCAGESMLCALYNLTIPLKGHINKESVLTLIQLAGKERFFKTDDNATSV
jgi:acetylornithine/succinyldiaminopimelate/putrescine aminotransferase/predicted amino acid dehydrogenase/long-subunit acyl-CoA synthetase (AMP-forming)